MNRARAREMRILHPPEKCFVALTCVRHGVDVCVGAGVGVGVGIGVGVVLVLVLVCFGVVGVFRCLWFGVCGSVFVVRLVRLV